MSRVSDLRLNVDFPDHPKTLALESSLGPAAPWALVRLFAWCARFRETGDLRAFFDHELETFARWGGEKGALVRELVRLGWLEGAEYARRIHDWSRHQGWVAGAEARSEAARRAALARWHPERHAENHRMPSALPHLRSQISSSEIDLVHQDHRDLMDLASDLQLELPELDAGPHALDAADLGAASSIALPFEPEATMGKVADDAIEATCALRAAQRQRPGVEPSQIAHAETHPSGSVQDEINATIARMRAKQAAAQREEPDRPRIQPEQSASQPALEDRPADSSASGHDDAPKTARDVDLMLELPAMRAGWTAHVLPATGHRCPSNAALTRALAEASAEEWVLRWAHAAKFSHVRGVGRQTPYTVPQMLNANGAMEKVRALAAPGDGATAQPKRSTGRPERIASPAHRLFSETRGGIARAGDAIAGALASLAPNRGAA
jgi:hypothetical protein